MGDACRGCAAPVSETGVPVSEARVPVSGVLTFPAESVEELTSPESAGACLLAEGLQARREGIPVTTWAQGGRHLVTWLGG